MRRLVVVLVLVVGCHHKTPPLQSHDLPMKTKGKSLNEPKCADNPPALCPQVDLQCALDEKRACYVCQCNMEGEDPDAVRTSQPPN